MRSVRCSLVVVLVVLCACSSDGGGGAGGDDAGAGGSAAGGTSGKGAGGATGGVDGGSSAGGSSAGGSSTGGSSAGGSSTGGSSAGGSAGGVQGGAGGTVGGLQCNQNDNGAPPITTVIAPSTTMPPMNAGGSIVPGTYFLTANTIYPGTQSCPRSDPTVSETAVFAETTPGTGTIQFVITNSSPTLTVTGHGTATYKVGATGLTGQTICPNPGPTSVVPYNATATEVRFQNQTLCKGVPVPLVLTFTKSGA
jgi:hypothetical protein